MSMANLPMIAWDEVPEGPVWYRHREATGKWWAGLRNHGRLLDDSGIHLCSPGKDSTQFVFTPAEQQPGEWAKERTELVNRSLELQAQSLTHYVELTRLRDGLAALEQTWRDHSKDMGLSYDQRKAYLSAANDVAALQRGR